MVRQGETSGIQPVVKYLPLSNLGCLVVCETSRTICDPTEVRRSEMSRAE